jgi:hypothetical protein
MADNTRDQDQMDDELNSDRNPSEDSETEREGNTPERNRGYDEGDRGDESDPTDPDSAESDVDRDDTVSD